MNDNSNLYVTDAKTFKTGLLFFFFFERQNNNLGFYLNAFILAAFMFLFGQKKDKKYDNL